jgi:hypothetical protein
MIDHVTATLTASEAYDLAARRARASRKRRPESCEWPDFAPPVALAAGPLGAVQAADREIGRQTARRARAVAEFAASRPASNDRPQGEPGAMSAERWATRPEALREVSEWAAQELVVALSLSTEAAELLLTRSLTLVHRLPGTLAALEAGALHPGHLWPMLEKVAPIENATVRAEVEAGLLRWAAGRVTTPAQLGAKARREVARRDARAAARKLAKAIARRGVRLQRGPVDGMATVTALLSKPEALVFLKALGAFADAVPDDPENPRTRDQKMADCLMDLVLHPGQSDRVSVQVLLTIVASLGTVAGGDEPGEIDGHVVPAETVRALLALFGPLSQPRSQTSQEAAFDDVTSGMGESADGRSGPSGWDVEEDLELLWAETERWTLADLLGPEPDPEPPGGERPDLEAEDFPQSNGEPPDVPAPHGEPPGSGTPARTATDDGPHDTALADRDDTGWWVAADRAVDEAGEALRHADEVAARARRLVRTASAADAGDEAVWQAGRGRFTDAEDALAVLRACSDDQRQRLVDLLAATGGGGLAERPRIALTDAMTGALLALTDLPGLRRTGHCGARACRRNPVGCTHDLSGRPGLGPPGPTDGYRPSTSLDRFMRARDRRCRFPGCRRPVPRGGELDHDRPFPDGPTSATNLTGYCTGHHRGKHQAPGWRHELHADGSLTVTTPTGLTAVTTPPPY